MSPNVSFAINTNLLGNLLSSFFCVSFFFLKRSESRETGSTFFYYFFSNTSFSVKKNTEAILQKEKFWSIYMYTSMFISNKDQQRVKIGKKKDIIIIFFFFFNNNFFNECDKWVGCKTRVLLFVMNKRKIIIHSVRR